MHIIWILLMLFLFTPSLAPASVYWNEDFENHLSTDGGVHPWDITGCANLGYSFPYPQDGCNGYISTDLAHGGTHSLKSDFGPAWPYRSDGGTGVGTRGTYYDRYFQNTTDIWIRFWYRTQNFTYFPTSETKLFYIRSDGGWIAVVGTMYASKEMEFQVWHAEIQDPIVCASTGLVNDTSCNYVNNENHVKLQDNQWYCIEAHANAGTYATHDGLLEIFVDGMRTMNIPNVLLRSSTGYYYFIRHYTQAADGYRYVDDLAVGDTRIGCGATASDTTAPTMPTNFQGTTSATPLLSWTASTDSGGTGMGTYDLRRCTVVSPASTCTPTVTLATVTHPSTTYTDVTAVAGTRYGYAVAAKDLAVPVNTSAYTATIYIDIPSQVVLAAPSFITPTTSATVPPGSLLISWTSVIGATGYYLRVHEIGTAYEPCSSTLFCNAVALTGTSQTVTVGAGLFYDMWVYATNGTVDGAASGNSISVSTDQTPPAAPGGLFLSMKE